MDPFKNALFSDPRYLSPISEKTKETFTDGIRSMEIDKSDAMLNIKIPLYMVINLRIMR